MVIAGGLPGDPAILSACLHQPSTSVVERERALENLV